MTKKTKTKIFSFGEPTPVLDGTGIQDYMHCVFNEKFYKPPMSWDGLAKSFRAVSHHSSPIYMKRNILTSRFIACDELKRQDFSKFVLDFLIFGNAYLEKLSNKVGKITLKPALAKYVCRDKKDNYYFTSRNQDYKFKKDSIFHLLEPDINQEIYGLPEYISALNSAWLNESATLFRRKYYENGSHAGFILYLNDETIEEDDVDSIREALKNSKGPGNFRNLFLHAPGGKKDGIQLIPVSDINSRDEFFNIKNVTRDDMYAAHRVPPQIMGVIPTNTSGLGPADVALQVFIDNEIVPLQQRILEVNDWLGKEIIKFKE